MTERDATKTIMVIDSSAIVREGLVTLLNRYGYRVKAAATRSVVAPLLEAGAVDLVLMEMSADHGSLEELRSLRSLPGGKDVPVVALIGVDDLGGVTACLDSGCDDFLLKPVSPRLLFQRIQILLEANPRAYNRVECQVAAEVTTGAYHGSGIVREIGEGGAGLIIEEGLAPGDIVKLTFPLPGNPDDVVVGAEIIYVQETQGEFLHGLRFIIIDTGTRARIRGFVQATLSDEG